MPYFGNTDQGKQILKCVNYYERSVNTHLLLEGWGTMYTNQKGNNYAAWENRGLVYASSGGHEYEAIGPFDDDDWFYSKKI